MPDTDLVPLSRSLLPGIAPAAFQHPLDRQATEQLRKHRSFERLCAKYIEYGYDRLAYVVNIASNVRVGPAQYPKLHALLQECCAILDVPEPEMYVEQGPVNAITAGHTRPYITLFTGLLELMNEDELRAVIGHELAHIKCGHVLYNMMANSIGTLSAVLGDLTFGIGALLAMPIEAALLLWSRRAELSCDRAALLVTQDAGPCVTMLMKLAGGVNSRAAEMDPAAFLEQAKSYGEGLDQTNTDKVYRLLASGFFKGTHPFSIERAKHLNDWVETREFERILNGEYARLNTPVVEGKCSNCGAPILPQYKFCMSCGKELDHRAV
ncbi:MAG TPA: M48 family metallopeptidase [Thermoflexales bacterium]|nr:M48 family metallopeptidase [Thermoflexales bacterium]